MEQKLVQRVLRVEGMTCTSCEMRIENVLKKIEGVNHVKAIFSSSNVYVTYDVNVTGLDRVIEAIEKLDYKVISKTASARSTAKTQRKDQVNVNQLLGIGIILLALYVVIKNTIGFNFIPQIDQSMGYGILFVVGILTSLHCIAMCGGINLSQCVSYKYDDKNNGNLSRLKPSFMYNTGRVISYTVLGGIIGTLGSVVSFSGTAKGIVAIVSGIFMVIMGLNMLNIFPWLRKLNPRMPKVFGNKIYNNNGKNGPFYVGLLNGLMPCGPLQAMQIYALGTGSFLAGAASMFFFSLGTVPLMFGFGAISSYISGKFTHKMMKVSAVLVMVLGVVMVSRGLNLSGVNVALAASNSGSVAKIENGIQVVTTKMQSGSYSPIVVQKGIPVRWTITAESGDLNGCNNPVTIPKFNIQKKLVPGENIIEFTPEEEGNITYTCWMGMISSNIKVVSDISQVSAEEIQQDDGGLLSVLNGGGGSCCSAGAKATEFAGGRIPTDNIEIAKIADNKQEVTVTVNDYGYSPAVVVLQKGVEAKIKFNTEQLNSCNNIVDFPEYQGELNLQKGQTETPWLTVEQDFTFQCWMGMLHGYVKVVDDINNVNMDDIKKEVQNFKPAQGSGAGCCGGQQTADGLER